MKGGAGEGELRSDRGLSEEKRGELYERHLADREGKSVKSVAEGLFVRCYGRYGCFRTDGVWTSSHRPLNSHPLPPEVVTPGFWLYTRGNVEKEELFLDQPGSLQASSLDPKKLTFLLTHGYLEHGNKKWIRKMRDALLKQGDHNVIILDWLNASGPPYTQACGNLRLVGRMTAVFLLQSGLPLLRLHAIGHSLGAQLMGYVGAELAQRGHILGRITGLDPAGPNFEETDPVVRLDPSDAFYVDVIHTDSNPILSFGLGMWQTCGHLDFYPNGGRLMEGCNSGVMAALAEESGNVPYALRRLVGCNHFRAYEYFTESITSSCPFIAVECSSWEDFSQGRCNGCTQEVKSANNSSSSEEFRREGVEHHRTEMCDQMGFYAFSSYGPGERPSKTGRSMHLLTGGEPPFCRYHTRVTIVLSDTPESMAQGGDRGVFYMVLHGDQGDSHRMKLSVETFFQPGRAYNFMATTSLLGKVSSADLIWEYTSNPVNPLTWRIFSESRIFVNRVIIEAFETHRRHTFCGEDASFQTGQARRLQWRPNCRLNGQDPGPGLLGSVLNADPVGDTRAVLDFVNPLMANPLNGLQLLESTLEGETKSEETGPPSTAGARQIATQV